MFPFGYIVRLWRLERKMTQARLAASARISQPNLSAIERGRRDLTLTTLRSLALALDVSPGDLADGATPRKHHEARRMSRETLERIARAAVKNVKLRDHDAAESAKWLRVLIQSRLAALGRNRLPKVRRSPTVARLNLAAIYPPSVVESLVQRAIEEANRP